MQRIYNELVAKVRNLTFEEAYVLLGRCGKIHAEPFLLQGVFISNEIFFNVVYKGIETTIFCVGKNHQCEVWDEYSIVGKE
ncbi:MAG: hypothetical protein J6Y37_18485 [Paludibacteraceae bacterium]|nr:hypothetical protein [Paludibacteraceae bacterium]